LKRGIVLFAHGSRDPEWGEPVQKLAGIVARHDPEASVVTAFLEHLSPPLEHAIATLAGRGVDEITVVPVFIAQGGHLKQDLPRIVAAIRETHPELTIALAPAMGESDAVLEAMADFASSSSRSAR
jgi:sirohydrochlorin cobaltochelatase